MATTSWKQTFEQWACLCVCARRNCQTVLWEWLNYLCSTFLGLKQVGGEKKAYKRLSNTTRRTRTDKSTSLNICGPHLKACTFTCTDIVGHTQSKTTSKSIKQLKAIHPTEEHHHAKPQHHIMKNIQTRTPSQTHMCLHSRAQKKRSTYCNLF